MSVIKLNREFILPLIVPQTQTEDTAMNHEPTTHESPSNQAAPCLCPAIKTQFHPFTWNLYCLYLFIFINVFFVQISPPIPPVNSHHVYYKGTIQLHHCYKVLNVIFFLLKKAKQRIMRQLFQNKCARSWVTDISDVLDSPFLGDFQKTAKLITLWWSLFFKKNKQTKTMCVRAGEQLFPLFFLFVLCISAGAAVVSQSEAVFYSPAKALCAPTDSSPPFV